eukprot:351877-Chlamydomonas_euryale.AAC.3
MDKYAWYETFFGMLFVEISLLPRLEFSHGCHATLERTTPQVLNAALSALEAASPGLPHLLELMPLAMSVLLQTRPGGKSGGVAAAAAEADEEGLTGADVRDAAVARVVACRWPQQHIAAVVAALRDVPM